MKFFLCKYVMVLIYYVHDVIMVSGCVKNCKCENYDNLETLICSSRNLPFFPPDISNTTQFLRFAKNDIEEIPKNLSDIVPKLQNIDLSENRIQELRKEAFRNLKHLESINLLNNNISKIDAHIFSGVESIFMNIIFRGNKISKIHPDAFAGLYADCYLDIGKNSLEELHEDTLKDVRGLLTLQMNGNKLKKIPKKLFRNTEQLFMLTLSDNQLEKLEEPVFDKLVSLESLFIASNKLKYFPDSLFSRNTALRRIKLNDNLFARPPMNVPKTTTITLEGNPIICDCELKNMLKDADYQSQFVDIHKVVCHNTPELKVKESLEIMDCTPTTTTTVTTTTLKPTNATNRNTSSINVTTSYRLRSTRNYSFTNTTTKKPKVIDKGDNISKLNAAVILTVVLVVIVLVVIIGVFVYIHRKRIASKIAHGLALRKHSMDSIAHDIVYQDPEEWMNVKMSMFSKNNESDI